MASDTKMQVIVVGAGLGGCAAALAMKHHGHDVVVYEKIRQFRRLGDSLGLGENALKLLRRWGGEPLYERLIRIGNQAENMTIRRWQDGKVLAEQPLMDMAGRIGHRGDYHDAFLDAVRAAGIPIHMGKEVAGYEEEADDDKKKARVLFADGSWADADVIVGADGIKSRARELVLGFSDAPRSSGYACFRAYMDGAVIKAAAQAAQAEDTVETFLSHDCVNIWIGIDTHLVQNTLCDGAEFNWIVTRKISSREREAEMLASESWFRAGDVDEVRRCLAGLDPRIGSAILGTLTDDNCHLLDWIICYRDPLPTWVSARSHRIALLGDSCHAHLPTSAQGASQAVESAAVLAQCLALSAAAATGPPSREPGPSSVAVATRAYEKLRFARTRQSQNNGEDLRDRWHSALRNLSDGPGGEASIDPESVKIRNRWLYAYDAEADTVERWPSVSAQVVEELRTNRVTPLC